MPGPIQEPGRDRNLDAAEWRFRAYALLLGGVCLAAAVFELARARDILAEGLVPSILFGCFIALSWFFSFSLFPRAHLSVSLDMAYMLTALCALPYPCPMLVAILGGFLGSVLRQLDREYRQTAFLEGIALNTGGLILSALAGQAVIARLGGLWTPQHLTWWTVGGLVALYAGYTLTNLLVMGVAVALRGEALLPYLLHYLRYAPTIEIFAIPLALGLTLLYSASGVWGFAPLGGTFLIASALLRKLNRAQAELSRANEQLQNRSRELRTLNTIGREISSSLDPQVVFGRIAANLQRILDAPLLFLSLRQRGATEGYVEFLARGGQIQPRSDRPLGEGFTNWMFEARRPLLLSDVEADRDALPCAPVILEPGVRALLATPLNVHHETIGVLSVQSPRPGAYNVDHLSVLATIAQQAAIAIDNARNYQMATVDQLTHLYLRDFFMRKLSEEHARARRYGSAFAALMLDLDRFKTINDLQGHLTGDRFLRRVGDVILDSMRAADVPCRWGGEEFCVLLPETDSEGALAIAERLRARVAELEMRVGDLKIRTTLSVGIACYPQDDPGTLAGFLERADRALYAAKQAGRDRVVMAASLKSPDQESAAANAG